MKYPRIAVLFPCYNEEAAIGNVIKTFRESLPEAVVYVYDNNSTDNSASNAKDASAIVRHVTRQGKGFVVQRMFADIEADIYVLVDGNATYDAASSRAMIARLMEGGLDMVVTKRIHRENAAYIVPPIKPCHDYAA
jgi:glycosyltransferase involved in cell wall biosynthesis